MRGFLGANLLLQAIWYTMAAAGMMESKNGIVGMLLWYTLLLYSAFCVNEEKAEALRKRQTVLGGTGLFCTVKSRQKLRH